MIDEEAPIRVGSLAAGKMRRRETELIEAREAMLERGRPRDHPVLRADEPAAPGQA
jgi:hypothetical protein